MQDGVSQFDALIAAGRACLREGRPADALAALEAAVRRRPDDPAAHYLRGEALFLLRRLEEALDSHGEARRHGIDRDWAARGAAMSGAVPGDYGWMTHMLRGDLTAAWRLADADRELRRRCGVNAADWPRHMRPVWDGEPLDGGRVLLRCYHGLGDTIHFARYLPPLCDRAAAVVVEAQSELLPLLSKLSGIRRVAALSEEDIPAAGLGCDREIDVTELPHAFRTTLETIPAVVPYLRPAPALKAAAARRLTSVPAGLRVGIVWEAGAWKPERSIPLCELAPLAAVPGVQLIALQRGPAYQTWRARAWQPAMTDGFGSDDISEAAATVANLDLVITVDTMMAHLAGALAVPVWAMLHFAADWRWLLDRADSPWYPTMRLFRQRAPGDWRPVVIAAAGALARLAER